MAIILNYFGDIPSVFENTNNPIDISPKYNYKISATQNIFILGGCLLMCKTVDIQEWFDLTLEQLKFYWEHGEYKSLSDCPFYDEAETYRRAMNYLIDANYMPDDAERLKLDTLENLIKE